MKNDIILILLKKNKEGFFFFFFFGCIKKCNQREECKRYLDAFSLVSPWKASDKAETRSLCFSESRKLGRNPELVVGNCNQPRIAKLFIPKLLMKGSL